MGDVESCRPTINDIKSSVCLDCPNKKRQIGFTRDNLLCRYNCWIHRAIEKTGVARDNHPSESVFADERQYVDMDYYNYD